jgi:hypothetical protein
MAEPRLADDPRALIPGDPDAIAANAVALRQRAAGAGLVAPGRIAVDLMRMRHLLRGTGP